MKKSLQVFVALTETLLSRCVVSFGLRVGDFAPRQLRRLAAIAYDGCGDIWNAKVKASPRHRRKQRLRR